MNFDKREQIDIFFRRVRWDKLRGIKPRGYPRGWRFWRHLQDKWDHFMGN